MRTLVISYAEAKHLLPMRECIDVMTDALSMLARGQAEMPLRTIFRPKDVHGVMAMMPSYRQGDEPLFGLKAICVFPDNPAIGKDAHQGGVLLFSGTTGELLAMVNASAITEIRTAAVSAVATRRLAREEASELAIIGAGVQARSHLEAIACVRPIKRGRIVARRVEKAQSFVAEMRPKFDFEITAVETSEEAVRDADIVVTATTSFTPVVQREWISPGTHINAVGTYSFKARELDTATVADATLIVDRRESALNEAGDYVIAAAEGAFGPEHIRAELGEVLIGSNPGRTSNDEITIFKSLGLAIEDLASAAHIYKKARMESAGTFVEFS